MLTFLDYVAFGLLGLLPIANPLTSATVLLALTSRYPVAERNRQINRATIYVIIVLLICFYAGNAVISGFGISIPGLRVAGGLIVSYIGFGMLFPPARAAEDEVQVEMASHDAPTAKLPDIAFIPLTMPCTTGPGTIAFIISASSSIPDGHLTPMVHAVVAAIVLLFALVFWLCMRGATPIMKWLGETGIDALARIMGFLLVCIGVQFVINGVHELLQAWGVVAA
ncbi:MAG TPA: MarC family NAAT transporter [Dyella sp.]|uniref:MarC family NAAT transporter n=1 Tax=Dyella sp. TaxID=1869338 RepID=UPI002D78857E|nr:MarC family NAAT transporter [Dyella sp.]HET6554026.1 MarC family NAAT transporter [Dyella sp.]